MTVAEYVNKRGIRVIVQVPNESNEANTLQSTADTLDEKFNRKEAWQCMNCLVARLAGSGISETNGKLVKVRKAIHAIYRVSISNYDYQTKTDMLVELRKYCAVMRDDENEFERDVHGGSKHNTANMNPFEKHPEIADDNTNDGMIETPLPKDRSCTKFIFADFKTHATNKASYITLDRTLCWGKEGIPLASLIGMVASIKYPANSRNFYREVQDGRIVPHWKKKTDKSSFLFNHNGDDAKRYSRHRKVFALFVKTQLMSLDTETMQAYLLMLRNSPRESIGSSVWYYLLKGDNEVRIPEAQAIEQEYSDFNISNTDAAFKGERPEEEPEFISMADLQRIEADKEAISDEEYYDYYATQEELDALDD